MAVQWIVFASDERDLAKKKGTGEVPVVLLAGVIETRMPLFFCRISALFLFFLFFQWTQSKWQWRKSSSCVSLFSLFSSSNGLSHPGWTTKKRCTRYNLVGRVPFGGVYISALSPENERNLYNPFIGPAKGGRLNRRGKEPARQ